MAYVTSFRTRLTRSARGELFNPLIYPFLFVTFSYGAGFTFFRWSEGVSASSLFTAMEAISPLVTILWGVAALLVIVVGIYVLVFDKPPVGKANCFVAWFLWAFAGMVYILTGGWLPLFAVAIPSLWFWTWQYLSLSQFRYEDRVDNQTMMHYDSGQYDDKNGGKAERLRNRGVDESDRTPD